MHKVISLKYVVIFLKTVKEWCLNSFFSKFLKLLLCTFSALNVYCMKCFKMFPIRMAWSINTMLIQHCA